MDKADKLDMRRDRLGEERLSFRPVKNLGGRGLSLHLCTAEGVLYLYSDGKKYKITLTEEEK